MTESPVPTAAVHPLAQRFLIALFALGISLPLLLALMHDESATAQFEQRRLAPPPGFPRDKRDVRTFPIKFEAYFNDRFGLRNQFIRWHNLAQIKWLGTPPLSTSGNDQLLAGATTRLSNLVIAGKDGWLFFTGDHSLDDYRGTRPFSEQDLIRWGEVLQARHDWLAAQGIPYLIAVFPEKHTIYGDYLPPSINRVSTTTRFDQLLAYCRRHTSVEMIDVRDAVRAARETDRCYHKYDSHWNEIGGFAAYQVVAGRLARQLPGFSPVQRSELERKVFAMPGGDCAGLLGLCDLYQEENIRLMLEKNRQAVFESRHSAGRMQLTMKYPRPTLPKAVIFHDSSFNGVMQYFAQHFSRAECYWMDGFDAQAVRDCQPDVVIQMFIERKLQIITPENPSDMQADLIRLAREKKAGVQK